MYAIRLLALLAAGASSGCVVVGHGPVETGSFEREFTVSTPFSLEVDTHSGSITVRGEDTDRAYVRAEIRAHEQWNLDDPRARIADLESDPPVEYRDGRLRIGRRVAGKRMDGVSARYEIVVPRQSQVLATAHSGSVTVEDVAGPVKASSHSGGVRAARIASDLEISAHSGSLKIEEIGGAVRASSHSGGHTVERVGGAVRATTHAGAIRLHEIGGDVEARAHSGGVTLVQSAPAAASVRVHSGSIEVTTVAGAGYDLRAKAHSGSIRLPDDGVNATEVSRGGAAGKLRGGGPALDLQTHSGGVRIK